MKIYTDPVKTAKWCVQMGKKKTLAKSNQIDRMALINEQNKKRFKHSS